MESSADSSSGEASRGIELYLKPDDVWDTNDVAELCPDVVAEFVELQRRLSELPPGSDITSVLPLHSLLVTRPD